MSVSNAPAIHPGEILHDLYLEPLEMSAGALAKILKVPRTRIERIVTGQTAITTDTALRLARFFRTTPQLWLNMQADYDLKIQAPALARELETIPEMEAA